VWRSESVEARNHKRAGDNKRIYRGRGRRSQIFHRACFSLRANAGVVGRSHCDEADEIRARLASLLEDAARSLQFCRSTEEVVEVLTNLLSELAKVLR